MTVYVPDDLKTSIDAVGEDDLNWSALAQLAFSRAIAAHNLKKDPTDMNAVVERLRASKQRGEDAQIEAGKKVGADWARRTAEFDDLEAVWSFSHDDGWGDLAALERLIAPEKKWDARDWADFWERLDVSDPSDAFARGFIRGAADVFDEVKDDI